MAKFCTKCGKELADGKACDCEKKDVGKKVASSSNGFDFNETVNNYVALIKGIFTKPADTIKKYATSDNFVLGIICLVINCLISGLFVYCLASEAISLVYSIIGLGFGSLGGFGGYSFEVPFIQTFLTGFAFIAVFLVVLALMIFVIANVIMKDKINVKQSFSLVGVLSVFTTITTLLVILLVYINITVMLIVMLLAMVFFFTYLYQGLSDITKVDKNKLAYVFVPAIGVTTFVVVYILPKILS